MPASHSSAGATASSSRARRRRRTPSCTPTSISTRRHARTHGGNSRGGGLVQRGTDREKLSRCGLLIAASRDRANPRIGRRSKDAGLDRRSGRRRGDFVLFILGRAGGKSFGSPSLAPPSTHAAISAISKGANDGSFANAPNPRAAFHFGIRRVSTSSLIATAHGRACW